MAVMPVSKCRNFNNNNNNNNNNTNNNNNNNNNNNKNSNMELYKGPTQSQTYFKGGGSKLPCVLSFEGKYVKS